ncbi:MAG: hypothetical protein ACYDBQ_05905 [Thermoplasmatota archaeon]
MLKGSTLRVHATTSDSPPNDNCGCTLNWVENAATAPPGNVPSGIKETSFDHVGVPDQLYTTLVVPGTPPSGMTVSVPTNVHGKDPVDE